MYEVKSCGVTIELTSNHGTALSAFNDACGPHVILYKFNGSGHKFVVNEKHSFHRINSRKQ